MHHFNDSNVATCGQSVRVLNAKPNDREKRKAEEGVREYRLNLIAYSLYHRCLLLSDWAPYLEQIGSIRIFTQHSLEIDGPMNLFFPRFYKQPVPANISRRNQFRFGPRRRSSVIVRPPHERKLREVGPSSFCVFLKEIQQFVICILNF